jgi:hypothetical protein
LWRFSEKITAKERSSEGARRNSNLIYSSRTFAASLLRGKLILGLVIATKAG